MPANSRLVFLDIAVYGVGQGRLEIELYPTSREDIASHFLAMCADCFHYNYTGTRFFGVVPGVALWGGDPWNNSAGNYVGFPEVCLPYPPLRLRGPGYLAAAPHRDGYGSQFILTLDESGVDHLRPGTIFGRVRNPESAIFDALQRVRGHPGPGTRSVPARNIEVLACGVLI